ncbi:MAG: UvrD-helicase domain-containing protein [Bacteroidia bacterium]|nr:UvrD-helicase domain-containing protein [Bacteroidia bacterium]
MNQQGLTIYKSSAGSGKTFTLVLEYLKLIILEPGQYRHVLAITFTNKATEEMKNRIIASLGKLATASEERLKGDLYFERLTSYLKEMAPEQELDVRKQARKALNFILNDYSNFAISTIESFFQRIIRAFARELNIPLGYDVEMRQEMVLEQIINDTLLDVGRDPGLTKLFVEFVGRNLTEEKSWNVDQEVKSLGFEIFKENFQELIVNLGEGKLEVSLEALLKLSKEVRAIRESFEKKMAALSEEALKYVYDNGLDISDFKNGSRGVLGYFLNIQKNQDYEPGKRARNGYEDEGEWVTQKAQNRDILLGMVSGKLQPLLRETIDHYEHQFPLYNSAKQVSRTIYSFGVLNNLREKLNEYRRENAQLIISDTNFLLNDIVSNHFDHAPFVYEKVGTQYYHYLLDEFQDTSEMQWKNILPLLHESLSYNYKSLIVGDVKQSIYRWRNGDWKLLLNKVESDVSKISMSAEVKNLQENWRTSKEIVEFNNRFFQEASAVLSQEFEDDSKFEMAYQEVRQLARKTRHSGLVEVKFFSKPSRKNPDLGHWKSQSLDHLGDKLSEIREDGFNLSDVTVLVRTNGEGVMVAEYLQEKGIEVVSAESLLLISDPKVRMIQALLQFLNHEDDSVAMAGLTYYFNQLILGQKVEHHWFERVGEKLEQILPAQEKSSLRQLPVYACVEEILNLFPKLKSETNAYLQGFLDAVLEYATSQDASISGFLTWWEKEKDKRSINAAPNPNAVQIMTVHKSKGLEFAIVFLPFADWSLVPEGRGVLWVKPQGEPYDSFSFFPVHPHNHLLKSVFSKEYREELIASKLDNLNITYVAFTRAKYRLYINSLKPGKKTDLGEVGISSLNRLIYQSVQQMEDWDEEPEDEDYFVWGKSFKYEEIADWEGKRNRKFNSKTLQSITSTLTDWEKNIRIKYQINPEEFRSFHADTAQLREGNLLHDALDWVIEKGDTEKAAHKMFIKGLVDEEGKKKLLMRLNDVVNHLQATDWFSGNWEVKNEAEIITSMGKILRPDRVMIQNDVAVVVDYKTGLPRESHQKQVQRYKDTLLQMGYRKVRGYLYYLSLNSVDEV